MSTSYAEKLYQGKPTYLYGYEDGDTLHIVHDQGDSLPSMSGLFALNTFYMTANGVSLDCFSIIATDTVFSNAEVNCGRFSAGARDDSTLTFESSSIEADDYVKILLYSSVSDVTVKAEELEVSSFGDISKVDFSRSI